MGRIRLDKDKLTGLLTRKTFEEQFEGALERAKSDDQRLSLIFFDIDRFKAINDKMGHQMGDRVIQRFSQVISSFLDEYGIIARYGGEEFAVICENMEREQAFLLSERVRVEMDKDREYKSNRKAVLLRVKISGGIAAYPSDGHNESEILRKADQALYRAKVTGRNKICIAQEERMITKTTHYTITQLERLKTLAEEEGLGEAPLLREALDDLLTKYKVSEIES